MEKIDYLIGCEESQAVTIELRKLGIIAFSCDTEPSSGGHPEWHIQEDVLKVIDEHPEIKVGIFFPPCTHLAVSGAPSFAKKREDGRQQEGIDFFMKLINAKIHSIAVENPIGIMSRLYRKPDQIVQPYFFGDEFQKTTCLWLKNLPPLHHNSEPDLFTEETTHVGKGEFFHWVDSKSGKAKKQPQWYADAFLNKKNNAVSVGNTRSKTFHGLAVAMATQWGKNLPKHYKK